jgi:hypothetical protein
MPEAHSQLERDLRQVYALAERSRRQDVERVFGKLGIPLVSYAAHTGMASISHGLTRLRRVA